VKSSSSLSEEGAVVGCRLRSGEFGRAVSGWKGIVVCALAYRQHGNMSVYIV